MTSSLFLMACGLLLAADEPPSDEQIRATIERSLPFIHAEGQRWIDEKKCVSCHQVPFMIWSLNAAADRGLVLDRQKLDDCGAWATDWQHQATKAQLELGERQTLSNHHDAVAQLLLGRSGRDRVQPAATWPALFAECLAAGQQDDGSWKSGGQLPDQKRPVRETQEVTTMWALVALQSYTATDGSLAGRFDKARSWLGNQAEGQSTEWWAVRLLVERAAGNGAEADRVRAALIKRQQSDGGWGWLTADESDAFGTGVALYALTRDGLSNRDITAVRARQFLMRTQQTDGSWPVKGTKKNKAKQIEPTATYWGTCWSIIGLAETLPRTALLVVSEVPAADAPTGAASIAARHPAESDLKTMSLFDGKTLDGWIQVPENSWIVKDSAMASTGAGRGVIYTQVDYEKYRLLFTMRHVSGEKDHRACVLIFCTRPASGEKPLDALAGIQFQPPNGGHWDYRKGHNNAGNDYFTRVVNPKLDEHQWFRVELLVDAAAGTGRMAVAQPVGVKALEVLQFKDPIAGRKGPIAWQMHNATLFDEYKDVEIEIDPRVDELITTR